MRKLLVAFLTGAFLFTGAMIFLAPSPADAIPAFARKHNVDCVSCHSAWPLLNASGRKFKESGYKFSESMEQDKNMVVAPGILFDRYFPITVLAKSYVYDKEKGKDKVIRPLHEYEIMVGGRAGERLSGFLELEGAYDNDFTPKAELGEVSYHFAPEANVLLGFVPTNWADPYESLSDWGRRMTRAHKAVLDKKYGGADGNAALRHPRQTIGVSGRAAGMVFYNVGYGSAADDLTGSDPKTLLGRVAVEFMPGIHVGGFGVSGKADSTLINNAATIKEEHKFSRTGLDFQAGFGDVLVYGVWLKGKDDPLKSSTSGTTTTYSKGSAEKNDGAYLEALYIVKDGVRPVAVPLLRWESYEENDGADKYNAVTANVGYYVTSNSKANVEYWSQTKVPSGKTKGNRTTLMFTILF